MPSALPGDPPPTRPTGTRYLVLAWFCAAAFIAYIQRMSIGVAAPRIREDLHLSELQMGWIMSGFYWAYALSQVPAGWLGDRVGSRRALAAYVALTSIMCGLVALADGFISLLVIWSLTGVAIAGIFPCCANSFTRWFPETGRALPSGFLGSSMSVGGAVATALTGLLLSLSSRRIAIGDWLSGRVGTDWAESVAALLGSVDWQAVYVMYAIPGLLWAVLFARWFRNSPAEHPHVNAQEQSLIRGGLSNQAAPASHAIAPRPGTPWRRLFTSPKMALVCGQQFCRAGVYAFFATWFPTYLKQTHGVSTAASGYLTSLPLLGIVLGGIVGGPVSDWIHRRTHSRRLSRQLLGALSQYGCGTLVLCAWFVETAGSAVLLIALGSFLFAFGSCAAYTLTIDLAGRHVATVFGTMNMAGNLGAAACPLLIAWLVDDRGLGWSWSEVLPVVASIYFIAGICWTALNPEGTIFDDPAR